MEYRYSIIRGLQLTILSVLVNIAVSSAGPNNHAVVSIDQDFRSDLVEIEEVQGEEGNNCYPSVNIAGCNNLHSYSIKLLYNKEIVRFLGASKTAQFGEIPFLESAYGKIAAFLTVPGDGMVEIAATLTGKDNPVSGKGVAAYFNFQVIKKGFPQFRVIEIKLVTPDGTIDTFSY